MVTIVLVHYENMFWQIYELGYLVTIYKNKPDNKSMSATKKHVCIFKKNSRNLCF